MANNHFGLFGQGEGDQEKVHPCSYKLVDYLTSDSDSDSDSSMLASGLDFFPNPNTYIAPVEDSHPGRLARSNFRHPTCHPKCINPCPPVKPTLSYMRMSNHFEIFSIESQVPNQEPEIIM